MWKLTDLASSEIERLEADGIHVTPQQVLYIQQLSLDVVSPVDGISLARGVPMRVGNVVLWPPTVASYVFFSKVDERQDISPRMKLYSLAYAMCYAHDADKVCQDVDLKAIRKWSRHLCCRVEELAAAVTEILGDGAKPVEKKIKDDKDLRYSVAAMAQEAAILCGGSIEQWEYQCTIPYVAEMIKRAIRIKRALEGNELKESDEALRKLTIYTFQIRQEALQNVSK